MSSIWKRKIPFRVVVVLVPSAIALMDWRYFFPLSAHPDFRFQIVGEFLELLVVASIIVLLRVRYPNATKKLATAPSSIDGAITAGGAFAAVTFIFEWRRFFPNDQFQPAGLYEAVLSSLLRGLLFGLFMAFSFNMLPFAFNTRSEKPSK